MSGKAKTIIITSDEDLARQLSLNKTTTRQIIYLDEDTQTISIEKDGNNFTQLSELNSKIDHIYKRTLDLFHRNRSKLVKTSKKSEETICAICGHNALGFNYNVISCASCKVFFRRYAAHKHSGKFRCITGENQCSVAHNIRRKCQQCRLDRCFAVGMREDFFISEEEKQRRRKYLDGNRNLILQRSSGSEFAHFSSLQTFPDSEILSQTLEDIDHLMMDMDGNDQNESMALHEVKKTLSVDDWRIIETIRSVFLSSFQYEDPPRFLIDVSNRISALSTWSYVINQIILNFISFFRRIDEFESLDLDDRSILIKYNFVSLYPIIRCLYYTSINECCSYGDNEAAEKHRRLFKLCGDINGTRDFFVNLVISLVNISEQDPILLSLLLTILIFSQSLSISEDQPLLKDSLSANRAQLYYTKLLWIYLIDKQGEVQACRYFIQLITFIFRLQSASKRIRDFFRIPLMSPDTMDQIAPLMQTVLLFS